MRNRLLKVLLVVSAAIAGVLFWQRRHETPPTPPERVPTRLRPAEPFMDPVLDGDRDRALQDTDDAPAVRDIAATAIPPAGTGPPVPKPDPS